MRNEERWEFRFTHPPALSRLNENLKTNFRATENAVVRPTTQLRCAWAEFRPPPNHTSPLLAAKSSARHAPHRPGPLPQATADGPHASFYSEAQLASKNVSFGRYFL